MRPVLSQYSTTASYAQIRPTLSTAIGAGNSARLINCIALTRLTPRTFASSANATTGGGKVMTATLATYILGKLYRC